MQSFKLQHMYESIQSYTAHYFFHQYLPFDRDVLSNTALLLLMNHYQFDT